VIDVRDDDYNENGHITNSIHIPFHEISTTQCLSKLDFILTALIAKLPLENTTKKQADLIFHCTRSQIRGPKSASFIEKYLSSQEKYAAVKVFVLEGGFLKWHDLFGNESGLVEIN
jgi:rhodanese-related sulfurtransferase